MDSMNEVEKKILKIVREYEDRGTDASLIDCINSFKSLIQEERQGAVDKFIEWIGEDDELPIMEMQPYLWAERNSRNYFRQYLRDKIDEYLKSLEDKDGEERKE